MDGREPSEYRPLEIETNILSHATGSASIRIILEGAGNLLDASSLVVKAALLNATQSNSLLLSVFQNNSKSVEAEVRQLRGDMLPLFVTIHKIGKTYIIDASKEEEACSLSRSDLQ
ncbi:unnamed protein product [Schistosoma mattheei]|uniref:Ribosomal RNA-processing protein 42 n=1 Tax=Schistosoma mattheei TaxID=31246 RepID=A0A183PDJ5_9TREM|nr:unnamed protein product [Schistosoma mattheei]